MRILQTTREFSRGTVLYLFSGRAVRYRLETPPQNRGPLARIRQAALVSYLFRLDQP
jgi:hypothetical protein